MKLPPEWAEKNGRRLALLKKQHSGFTEEENRRQFDAHPGWRAECDRRFYANLTDAERAELDELDRWTSAVMAPYHQAELNYLRTLGPAEVSGETGE